MHCDSAHKMASALHYQLSSKVPLPWPWLLSLIPGFSLPPTASALFHPHKCAWIPGSHYVQPHLHLHSILPLCPECLNSGHPSHPPGPHLNFRPSSSPSSPFLLGIWVTADSAPVVLRPSPAKPGICWLAMPVAEAYGLAARDLISGVPARNSGQPVSTRLLPQFPY